MYMRVELTQRGYLLQEQLNSSAGSNSHLGLNDVVPTSFIKGIPFPEERLGK